VRLVAGFAAAMLVLLTAAGAFVYWRVEYALDRGLDGELRAATAVIAPAVGPDGRVTSGRTADATGTGWQVLAADGDVLDAGGPAPTTPLVDADRLREVDAAGAARTLDVGSFLPVADQPYRVRVSPLTGPGPAAYLLVGVRRDHRDEALRELLLQLALAGLGALAVASLVGDLLARSALRPVERYRRRAAEISAGASGLRLDVPPVRDDEVTRLGHTLNEMLGALEDALARERRFVHDASHELRTPLTLLRSRIQLTRRRTRTVAEHEQALAELELDVTRLADLAEQLLALDRSSPEDDAAGDLAAAVTGTVPRWLVAHAYLEDEVRVEAGTGELPVPLAPRALERVVTNLLDNAVVHGRPPLRVRVRAEGAWAVLEVVDAGDGMPAELLALATRRFHRAVEARSRPGAGLGLAIVEQLTLEAGGELRLCHAGAHASSGDPLPPACTHDAAMTVSVLLPRVSERA
jgi:signal transduction histidine kinase